jgi:hypothetical protein
MGQWGEKSSREFTQTGLTQKIVTESRRHRVSGNILQPGIPSPACSVVTLRLCGRFFLLPHSHREVSFAAIRVNSWLLSSALTITQIQYSEQVAASAHQSAVIIA